jgi:signal transduction histidine kinase
MLKYRQSILAKIDAIGVTPDDDEELRLKKVILVRTSILIGFAGLIWGLLYLLAGEPLAAAIPLGYATMTVINLLLLRGGNLDFNRFRILQSVFGLFAPFLLMLVLGGYVNGSAVIVWSFLAPLGAVLYWERRRTIQAYATFITLLVVAGLLTPILPQANNLSRELIIVFFVFNISAVSAVAFVTLLYFFQQKELALELMHKNRELERANLEQELLLRQNEKLAMLGRLSAGIAHELNNPAAAAQRGAVQLKNTISQLEQSRLELGMMNLTGEQCSVLDRFKVLAQERADLGTALDPIERSDREYAIEHQLEDKGLDNAWEYAPILIDMQYEKDDVAALSDTFPANQFSTVITSLSSSHATHTLLDEIGQGTERITEIVQALKTYTYLDQGPVQFLDIHKGLDNTLVMLRSKLKSGVDIQRDYADDLPQIQGYGSELNQVWTNIIDNAIDAMDGAGELRLRTRHKGESVLVEITDNGPGIPDQVAAHIFDPFYTTKAMGEGTGLGLNTSHNIITKQHQGEISVRSRPGETTFTVKLPVELSKSAQ